MVAEFKYEALFGCEVTAKDFMDDRLADALRYLPQDATWQMVQQRLGKHLIQVYQLPTDITRLDGTTVSVLSQRQKDITELIRKRGSITRRECQRSLNLRQKDAQNGLLFLYRLGVLGRTLGKRKKATYFLSKSA